MSNLRQAAQQALYASDALEKVRGPFDEKGMAIVPFFYLREFGAAMEQLRQALAEPEPEPEPVAIKWALNGDKRCGYDNWLGETPFGRILITWKSWKDFPNACVDEFPGGFEAYGDPEKVKVECEAEFRRRIGAAPTPRKPDDDEVEQLRAQNTELDAACAKLEAENEQIKQYLEALTQRCVDDTALIGELASALNAMLTHMGMDEDESNKGTFNQARAALAKAEASNGS